MKQNVAIFGGSGHAKMVIEAMRTGHEYHLSCCLVPEANPIGDVLGVPLRSEAESELVELQRSDHKAFVAIGCNRLRRRITGLLRELGFDFASVVSRAAWVSPTATIGPGAIIMPGAVVGASAVIGEGCIINSGATVDHDCKLSSFVHVGPGCHLAGNVIVGSGSFLGVGCNVVPEVRICAEAIVGAGAVVIKNLEISDTYVGIPARRLHQRGTKLAA